MKNLILSGRGQGDRETGVERRQCETQCQNLRPTLMRSPVVTETHDPSERFFCVFPLRGPRAVAIRQRVLTSFPDTGTDPTYLHHTRMEAPCHHDCGDCRGQLGPLRLRNLSVPAYRPTQRGG